MVDHSVKQASYATVDCAAWSWEYTSRGRAVSDCWMTANMSKGGPNTMCHSLSPFPKKTWGGGNYSIEIWTRDLPTLKCYRHSTATCSMIWGMQTGWITGLTKRTEREKQYVYCVCARAHTIRIQLHMYQSICNQKQHQIATVRRKNC